jgi:chaperonin GroEL (HSP60 family)
MMAIDLDIVTSKSLLSPISKIISNAAKSADDVWIGKMYKYPTGYDVKDYKIVNMFDAGILDTAKGVKNALINAASASNNLLRTNNTITLKRFAK